MTMRYILSTILDTGCLITCVQTRYLGKGEGGLPTVQLYCEKIPTSDSHLLSPCSPTRSAFHIESHLSLLRTQMVFLWACEFCFNQIQLHDIFST